MSAASTATRTVRSLWTFSASLVFTATTMIIGFVTTPALLRLLGTERFGAFRTLADTFGYLLLLDLGFSGALGALFSGALAGPPVEVHRALTAALRVYLWITLAMIAASGALVSLAPFLIPVKSFPTHELVVAGIVLATGLIAMPTTVFRALLEARQRGYVVQSVLLIQSVATTAGLVFAAWRGWGLPGQAAATTIFQLFAGACYVAFAMDGGMKLQPKEEVTVFQRRLRELNWPTLVLTLTDKLSFFSNNVIVASILGARAVPAFYITQRLATIAQVQLQAVAGGTWAGLVELHHQGNHEVFRKRMGDLTALVAGAGFAVLAPIAAFNSHFVRWWLGAALDAGAGVNYSSALNAWLLAIFTLWSWPVTGTGNVRALVPLQIISTIVNVAISIGATFIVGSAGPLLGTTAGYLFVFTWAMPGVLLRVFGISWTELWIPALRQTAWGIPLLIGLTFLSQSQAHIPFIALLAEMAFGAAIGFGLWWMFGIDPDSRSAYKGSIERMAGSLLSKFQRVT